MYAKLSIFRFILSLSLTRATKQIARSQAIISSGWQLYVVVDQKKKLGAIYGKHIRIVELFWATESFKLASNRTMGLCEHTLRQIK